MDMQTADHSVTESTFCILNLHCPSCFRNIETSLEHLSPQPISISCSIISHSITVRHPRHLAANTITVALDKAGFEIYSVTQADEGAPRNGQQLGHVRSTGEDWGLEQAVSAWKQAWRDSNLEDRIKRNMHMAQCLQCQDELQSFKSSEKLIDKEYPLQDPWNRMTGLEMSPLRSLPTEKSPERLHALSSVDTTSPETFRATFSIEGMTCSACVGNITRAISQHPWVQDVSVLLLSNSASVTFLGRGNEKHIVEAVEDAGYDITLEDLQSRGSQKRTLGSNEDAWKATFSITGMTCSACVGTITTALEQPIWMESVQVNLISNSATVSFHGREHLDAIKDMIEDLGYDASVEVVQSISQDDQPSNNRDVVFRIEGMYCHHCPERILRAISEAFGNQVKVDQPFSAANPLLKLNYEPRPPNMTLRHIVGTIDSVDTSIKAVVYHPPTVEERSREIHAAERRKILIRLALSAVVAVPTFVIGVVYMSLVKKTNIGRQYLMENIWAGRVSRAEWALFIMSTVVYFLAADLFHIRTLKGLKVMWRRGSSVPLFDRIFRFGNMNMLISLGTSIAYFASIAQLAISATEGSDEGEAYYFDSVVFLTMFLLAGRFLEAYSKARTGDAVAALGSLRPAEALLVSEEDKKVERTSVDLLEIGDVVLVPHGSSPPFDGMIVDGETNFDESSLTGESRFISKHQGDPVYSGSINKGPSVSTRLTSISGTSMLDQIVKVVREGQTKRAPVERVADMVTSHFVPFVVLVAILTFIIWLALGLSDTLPQDYRDTSTGGWTFWSLQFSIAVFVVACPCGIGLAAPTALFVGGGLAAKHGILVKGGGEAFQEASSLDCIVFDKTGTLTKGVPTVTDCEVLAEDKELVMGMAKALEENSNHPIARSIVEYSRAYQKQTIQVMNVEEMAGKGMRGHINLKPEQEITLLIGNEAFMAEYGVEVPGQTRDVIQSWKHQGKSVALLSTSSSSSTAASFELAAAFAMSDPLRAEATSVVELLQKQRLEVWLVSGDNATTANSIGQAVGIPASNIMAGVLPAQKAEKIKYLQRTLPARRSHGWIGWGKKTRATVAMVGDGINDAPALATADVGIAMGSGSDVALSTASFVLIMSDLDGLISLIELSRAVFARIWLNFGWALIYNMMALPVAAGGLYAIKSGDSRVRLDPVWASLAMALSSVSVVLSSLALRLNVPVVGFRASRWR